jgi:hypothetical protein
MARCITLYDKVFQCLSAGLWFSPNTPVFSTNKIDRHDITEILLTGVIHHKNKTNDTYIYSITPIHTHICMHTYMHIFIFQYFPFILDNSLLTILKFLHLAYSSNVFSHKKRIYADLFSLLFRYIICFVYRK